ncbi:MAG: xanthine dehydrogenase family protein subunit M [Hyphomicrobiales bacterium]
MIFECPKTLDAALDLLSSDKWSMLSGGTDFYPSLQDRQPEGNILDISKIAGLKKITKRPDGSWSIGALVTWTDVIKADLPPAFDGLKLAAREVGSVQIQNRATLAGNICNASPAADGMPPLLSLDALVEITSIDGNRRLPISAFVLGNRKIDLSDDEIVTAIIIPADAAKGASSFLKLGARKYLVISISMVAARIEVDDQNTILGAAISVGSCSLVAKRLTALEAALVGQPLDKITPEFILAEHMKDLAPIDDVRASGVYRMDASRELVGRVIADVQGRLDHANSI